MMSAQMLAAATRNAEAAEAAGQDSMRMLDAEAETPQQPVRKIFAYSQLIVLFILISCNPIARYQSPGANWEQHYVRAERHATRHFGGRSTRC